MRQGPLSNREIESSIGRCIFIYPYNPANMNGGSTYNLTASIFAYFKDDEGKNIYAVEKLIDGKKVIVIPPHKTLLIQTEECLYVSNKICGTYHSKVSLVCKGLSHIGTTLDPEYFGTSLIALQNTTDAKIKIEVGKTFISLMFYKMRKRSNPRHDNSPGRTDISSVNEDDMLKPNGKEEIDSETKQSICAWREASWRKSLTCLKEECKKAFAETKKGRRLRSLLIADFVGSLIVGGLAFAGAILNLIFGWIKDLPTLSIIMASIGLLFTIKTAILKSKKEQMEG